MYSYTTGVRVLMGQMADSAQKMGFSSSRVDVRVNARGELVIAVLIPPRCVFRRDLSTNSGGT
jgi:hypothetical protein